MELRARVELAVGALVLAAVGLYAVGDDSLLDKVLYLGVIVAASVAAWVGAERAPAEHRVVGRLIAAGISLTAVGDTLWEVLDATGPTPDVSIADPAWFASYVMLSAALCVVLRRSSTGTRDDLAFVIDAITIVVVSVLVFWSLSINAIVADDTVAAHVRAVWAAYPVADAVLLALVIRVLTSHRSRAAIDASFAAGVCLWLAADLMYLQSPTGGAEIAMDAAWMIAPVLIARTAWRMDAAQPAQPAAAPEHRGRVAQLGIAVGPLLVPPVLEYTADVRGKPDQPTLLLVGSAILTLLAFVRMALLVRSEEHARRELEVARDAALAASQAKSMFLATMSHEIRTPLTMVLGTGEMLEGTDLDDLQLDLVRRMRRSGSLLRALVDGILDFSRIEAGQLELAVVEFDLCLLVDDLVDVYVPRATQRGVTFECRVDPGVPRAVVGDPDRLLQVLSNLLDNALKFTHEGQVGVEVRPAGADVELRVSDTGIGMRQGDLASVFESFNQLDGSTTRRYGGSGLGLAICKQLTELMGGSLSVDSELGHGSVFTARVPLAPAGSSAMDPATSPVHPLRRQAPADAVPSAP